MKTRRATVFSRVQWHWTGAKENLFLLSRAELKIFTQLCREANAVA